MGFQKASGYIFRFYRNYILEVTSRGRQGQLESLTRPRAHTGHKGEDLGESRAALQGEGGSPGHQGIRSRPGNNQTARPALTQPEEGEPLVRDWGRSQQNVATTQKKLRRK